MLIDQILNRRSIRKYTDQDIPADLLNSLLAASFKASNTGNMQVYSVIVTRDAAQKKALSPFHFNQPMITQAPVVLTFCADFHRFTKWCELSNAKPGYKNFLSFTSAMTDALLVAQTFTLLAEEAGLGICFLGTTNYMPAEISKVLNLPELVVPITTVTVGYPAEDPALTERLPAAAIIHEETYQERDVKADYAALEALPVNQAFVKENNKESLAQVFTDIRYNQENNEEFSARLLQEIKDKGFL